MAGKRGRFGFSMGGADPLLPLEGLPNVRAYSMSKFPVRGLLQSLSELVPLFWKPLS